MTSAEKHTDNDEREAEEAVEPKREVEATPAAKRKAEELGADLSKLEGTGAGGRVTLKDLERVAE